MVSSAPPLALTSRRGRGAGSVRRRIRHEPRQPAAGPACGFVV